MSYCSQTLKSEMMLWLPVALAEPKNTFSFLDSPLGDILNWNEAEWELSNVKRHSIYQDSINASSLNKSKTILDPSKLLWTDQNFSI